MALKTPLKSKVQALLEMAQQLQQDLAWVPKTSNGLDQITHFFILTSECQETCDALMHLETNFLCKNENQRKFVTEFQKWLQSVGRNQTGWNRTPPGQPPTPATVFILANEPFRCESVEKLLQYKHYPSTHVEWTEAGTIESVYVNPFIRGTWEELTKIIKNFEQ